MKARNRPPPLQTEERMKRLILTAAAAALLAVPAPAFAQAAPAAHLFGDGACGIASGDLNDHATAGFASNDASLMAVNEACWRQQARRR